MFAGLKGKVADSRANLDRRVTSMQNTRKANSEGVVATSHSHLESPSPPPPPSGSRKAPPPPVARGKRITPIGDANAKSEARFSEDDKHAFFGLLDSFFELKGRGTTNTGASPLITPPATSFSPRTLPPATSGPPLVRNATRPPPINDNTRPPSSSPDIDSNTQEGPEAYRLCVYFHPSTPWTVQPTWFAYDLLPPNTQPTPPPLANRDVIRATSWSSHGAQKSLHGIALFEDLSIAWYHISWTNPNNPTRQAAYTSSPNAWDADDLQGCAGLYGDLVAAYSERALDERRHVGRGECWDLANDSLKEIGDNAEAYEIPKVMPCIGKTHGHLIYSAVGGRTGTWRGGDDTVRRGDIVQWETVKIKLVGKPMITMTLGSPDHTAIIVSDSHIPSLASAATTDDRPLDASAIGSLDVIEQSVRELPTRRVYDMTQFMVGKVWIYRPVPMESYVGISAVTADWPPPHTAQFTYI